MHWISSGHDWIVAAGRVRASVYVDIGEHAWVWQLDTSQLQVRGLRTYKTAAGARAACERVARRLGVVC
jgi:hypothetical protein